MKKEPIPAGIYLNGHWCYKLPDPYRQIPFLPLDAVTLAEHLEISYRTALRVCQGQRRSSSFSRRS